ncbi:MAG: alpha/beta hydrolase-fold protein [Pseudomonadota bacterium]
MAMMKSIRSCGFALLLMFWSAEFADAEPAYPLEFSVEITEEAASRIAELGLEVPLKGRVFVIITRDADSEPREQAGVRGVPLWGKDVSDLRGGERIGFAHGDVSQRGYLLEEIGDIPAGEYTVQAFLNVYTTFERADGHVLEMHLNSGAHQNLFRSPGNAYSPPLKVYLDPTRDETIELALSEVIAPARPLREGEVLQQGLYDDTDWVKYVKIRSEKVSAFWGRDMYIGANILLPKGYADNPDKRYPVLYLQGHSSGFAPVPWSPEPWFNADFTIDDPGIDNQLDGFYEAWTSGAVPEMIVVTFRDANPFFDTSYSVNTANLGPYGDAIMDELIPYIESNFRIIREPRARALAGRSTGGWEALAMMVWYPDFFGGTWVWAPDPIDFRKYTQMNIYEDDNAYYREYAWLRTERPRRRDIDGLPRFTIRNAFDYDQTIGDRGRSGGQLAAWQALYSPVGDDGYPAPLWEPESGAIDREVAAYWGANYDITRILRTNWATLGPKLRGKLHFAVGITDNSYLNEGVHLIQEFLEATTAPPAEASFEYGWRGYHSWIGHSPVEPERQMTYAEFIQVIADYMEDR